jgi:hypothetical protein
MLIRLFRERVCSRPGLQEALDLLEILLDGLLPLLEGLDVLPQLLIGEASGPGWT